MHFCSSYPSSFVFLWKEDTEGKTEGLISYGVSFFPEMFFWLSGMW